MDRPSFSYKTVFIGLALSLALGSLGALYVFNRFTTFEPVALYRVPEHVETCTRLNLQQALLYDPLNQYLLPVLERGKAGPESRIKHIERKTTLELDVDARELVFATLSEQRWLLVIAGFLRHQDVLEGVERVLSEEKIPYERRDDVLVHPSKIALGVAADGTLLLGSDGQIVLDARERHALPSWAKELDGLGVLAATFVAPGRRAGGAKSHLLGGTVIVKAETYFPALGQFLLDGDNWTEAQLIDLFRSKEGDFTYLFPIDRLRPELSAGGRVTARETLGRERFDGSIRRFAEQIDRVLPPAD